MRKSIISICCAATLLCAGEAVIKQGWNLKGGLLRDELNSSNITTLYAYKDGVWLNNTASNFTITKQDGIWIKSSAAISLSASKSDFELLSLKKGWNLVGGVEDAKRLIDTQISAFYLYKDQKWELNPTAVGYFEGIWIYANSELKLKLKDEVADFPTMPSLPDNMSDEFFISDADFGALSTEDKKVVLDKLLGSLFIGLSKSETEALLNSPKAITQIKAMLSNTLPDTLKSTESAIEGYNYNKENIVEKSLARLLLMPPSREYVDMWVAYNLINSKFFSASRELNTVMNSNGINLFQRLYSDISQNIGITEMLFSYLTSEEHWRRFRSPEDNTRETLELQLGVFDDTLVPKASKACQNYSYNEKESNLVIDFNYNYETQEILGASILRCDDFYSIVSKNSMVKENFLSYFLRFYFPSSDENQRDAIKNKLALLSGDNYKDLLFGILFSDEYLLKSTKAKTIEELYLSSAKKMGYTPSANTFKELKTILDSAHQPSMYYKLGRELTPPLDILSFSVVSKNFRDKIMLDERSNMYNEYDAGWSYTFLESLDFSTLDAFLDDVFSLLLQRAPSSDESATFKEIFKSKTLSKKSDRLDMAKVVFDYFAQTPDIYVFRAVKE